jgi:sortase (surface protein transpeptidase)
VFNLKRLYTLLTSFALTVTLAGCSTQSGNEMSKETPSPIPKSAMSTTEASAESKIEIVKDNRKGIIPATIEIPAINVNTSIEHVGTLKDGRMDVPKDPDNVGWYKPGTLPGAHGNAVLAGHVDDLTSPAVFYDLHKLVNGDKIIVKDQNGDT